MCRLPHNLQDRWTAEASQYKDRFKVPYPPFSFFEEFLRRQARIRSDPSFLYHDSLQKENDTVSRGHIREKIAPVTKKTETEENLGVRRDQQTKASNHGRCPIHKSDQTLKDCRTFKSKPISERRKFLRSNGFCFKCCESTEHVARQCTQIPNGKILHVNAANALRKSEILQIQVLLIGMHGRRLMRSTKESTWITLDHSWTDIIAWYW